VSKNRPIPACPGRCVGFVIIYLDVIWVLKQNFVGCASLGVTRLLVSAWTMNKLKDGLRENRKTPQRRRKPDEK